MRSTTAHRCIKVLAAALSLALVAGAARAQTFTYTVSGIVTSVSNPSGPWAGVVAGDPMRLAFIVRPGEPPTAQTPTSRTFIYPDSFAGQPVYVTAGPYRADFQYELGLDAAEFIIADDDGPPSSRDLFRGAMHSAPVGDILFEFSETAPAAPVATAMSGLDWPAVAELDLSTWDTARLEISGDFGAGPMVISGAITSVLIQDVDCWRIDYTEDGLLDFGDYLQFLSYYSEGDPRADLCGCGLVDFQSYLDFLNYFDSCGGT